MYFDWINRICVFYLEYKWAEDVFRRISEKIPQDAIQLVRKSKYEMKILLKDGSFITFLPASENIRGRVFNRIYYQDGISNEIINERIRPMWRSDGPTKIDSLKMGD